MPADASPSFVIPEEVVFEVLGEEAVLLNLRTGVYFRLNDTGTRIWQLIEAGERPAEVVETMAREYEVDRESARRDVDRLVDELTRRQLLNLPAA